MSIQQEIENIAQEAIQRYCMITTRDFLEDKKKEGNLTKQYKGREIYELLQNIDDAATNDGMPCIASIIFDGNYLIVSNNGIPFNISTLQRLCQGGVSEKNSKFIGCKGLGFRSVLNWADEISIYSGSGENYISVKFSRKYAQCQLDKLLNNRDLSDRIISHLKEQIDDLIYRGFDSSYPIFRAPQYIPPIEKSFDTVIKLKVKEENKEQILNDIENLQRYRYILLFLPHLTEIRFEIKEDNLENKRFVYSKGVIGDKVELTIDNNGVICSNSYICEKREETLTRQYEGTDEIKLGIALPYNKEEIKESCLYNFFPVFDLPCPFKAILNATFLLIDNRNDIDLNNEDAKEINKIIFERLLSFYIETVVTKVEGERRLELLQPINFPRNYFENFTFGGNLSKLGKENFYFNTCFRKEIFYTVNGFYMKGEDSPIVLDSFPFSNIFIGKHFSNLVKYIDNIYTRSFAKKILQSTINVEEYLCNAINDISYSWENEKRIKVFKWWHSQNYTSLPKLLKTIDGKFLNNKTEPCFLSEDTIPEWVKNIPKWATISVLDSVDQKQLIVNFKKEIDDQRKNNEADKRVLARIINKNLVDIQEQSSRQVVISPINASVNGNFEYAVEFLSWLWQVWRDSTFDETIKNKINFVVPTKGKSVVEAKNVFLGEEYGNILGKSIFNKLEGYFELYKIEFEDATSDRIVAFLKDIGVSKYPRLKEIRYNQVDGLKRKFIDYVVSIHPINLNNGEWIRSYNSVYYTIEEIEKILNSLDSKSIIKWIYKDSELKNAIENNMQPKNCCIEYLLSYKHNPWRHNNEWQLPSYLRYVFSNSQWLEIKGTRYSPSQLIITDNDYLCDFGLECISESDIEYYSNEICNKEDLRKLLAALGAKKTYFELESNRFYGLLLALPNGDIEKAKKISRDLYRSIIDNSSNLDQYKSLYIESENRKKFRQEGKVLVKKALDSSFIDINQAFFSSSAVLNDYDKFPIDVPARRGKKEDFEKILFIKPFEIAYSVEYFDKSECDNAFQQDLESFIPCIMAYRKGRKDDVCNLAIELVSKVSITYNSVTKECTSGYTLFKKTNRHWLICVGNEIDYFHIEKGLIADKLVQIFNVLFNFPSKEFLNKVEQLFIYSDKQRRHSIEEELGSIEEIELARREINQSKDLYSKIVHFFDTERNEDYTNMLKQVNWNNFTLNDQKIIIDLLKKSNKTIAELSLALNRTIDISDYNKNRFLSKYESDYLKIKCDVYYTIKDEIDKRKDFNFICGNFENIIKEYNDGFESIDFDFEETYNIIKSNFYSKYNILHTENQNYNIIKLIYDRNVENLKELFKYTDLSLIDFTNSPENDSLLYFEDGYLDEIVKEFINKQTEIFEEERNIEHRQIGQISSLYNNAKIGKYLTSGTPKCESSNAGNGGFSKFNKGKLERRNKRQGNVAEYIVVLKLQKKEIEQVNAFFDNKDYSIYWVSGAAKDILAIEDDRHEYHSSETNDKAGYDIRLVASDLTKTMYIEVKSSSSENCSFFMSSEELSRARIKDTSSEKYRIIFVSNINLKIENCHPEVTFIDAPVDEVFDLRPVQYNMIFREDKYNQYKII